MPKFSCKCGKVHNLSTWSTDAERMLVIERQFHLATEVLSNSNYDKEKFYDTFYEGEIDVIFCDQCKRMHLYNGQGDYTTYIVEND